MNRPASPKTLDDVSNPVTPGRGSTNGGGLSTTSGDFLELAIAPLLKNPLPMSTPPPKYLIRKSKSLPSYVKLREDLCANDPYALAVNLRTKNSGTLRQLPNQVDGKFYTDSEDQSGGHEASNPTAGSHSTGVAENGVFRFDMNSATKSTAINNKMPLVKSLQNLRKFKLGLTPRRKAELAEENVERAQSQRGRRYETVYEIFDCNHPPAIAPKARSLGATTPARMPTSQSQGKNVVVKPNRQKSVAMIADDLPSPLGIGRLPLSRSSTASSAMGSQLDLEMPILLNGKDSRSYDDAHFGPLFSPTKAAPQSLGLAPLLDLTLAQSSETDSTIDSYRDDQREHFLQHNIRSADEEFSSLRTRSHHSSQYRLSLSETSLGGGSAHTSSLSRTDLPGGSLVRRPKKYAKDAEDLATRPMESPNSSPSPSPSRPPPSSFISPPTPTAEPTTAAAAAAAAVMAASQRPPPTPSSSPNKSSHVLVSDVPLAQQLSFRMDPNPRPREEKKIKTKFTDPFKAPLRCVTCFKAAELWCTRCVQAYCIVCWNKIPHHALYDQMTTPDARIQRRRQPSIVPTNEESSPKKSYSSSVLFTSFPSAQRGGGTPQMTRHGSGGGGGGDTMVAPPPHEFEFYPDASRRPQVFLGHDGAVKLAGRGEEGEDDRPASRGRNAMVSTPPRSRGTTGTRSRPSSQGGGGGAGGENVLGGVSALAPAFHYQTTSSSRGEKGELPRSSSRNKIVIKAGNPQRPKSPSLTPAVGRHGGVAIAPGRRVLPSAEAIIGITRDFQPVDWKVGLFQAKDPLGIASKQTQIDPDQPSDKEVALLAGVPIRVLISR